MDTVRRYPLTVMDKRGPSMDTRGHPWTFVNRPRDIRGQSIYNLGQPWPLVGTTMQTVERPVHTHGHPSALVDSSWTSVDGSFDNRERSWTPVNDLGHCWPVRNTLLESMGPHG